MTMKPLTIMTVAAIAALALQPPAAAQGTRTQPPPAPRRTPAADQPSARPAASTVTRSWTDQEYKLGAGDKLRVEVYNEAQLSQSLQVRPDGKITLPLIGDVTATGRTSTELRDSLATALKEYITNPVVTVIIIEAVAAQVHVIGEVPTPGVQIMQGPLTVLQALAQAGGLKEFADASDIRILRRVGNRTQTIAFNYKDAVRGRIEPVYLQPGDTLVVP